MSDPISTATTIVDGERTDHDLVFYSLSTCIMCRKARRYLEDKGYRFRVTMVDKLPPEEKEQLKRELTLKHGVRVVFPALTIDDRRIVLGFFRKAWDDAIAEERTDG